ncbi:hypothetical protein HKX48_008746 [Thoreauomyces humboldtii]|nr:hypothetical protein HKX48_008746 [Thoreauomyces humboldtii]
MSSSQPNAEHISVPTVDPQASSSDAVNDPLGQPSLPTTPKREHDADHGDGPPLKRTQSSVKRGAIASHLTCLICHEMLHNPLAAPCLHTFCASCWTGWAKRSRTCPVCRAPARTITPNFIVKGMVDSWLDLYPEKRRPQDELDAMDAMNEYKGPGIMNVPATDGEDYDEDEGSGEDGEEEDEGDDDAFVDGGLNQQNRYVMGLPPSNPVVGRGLPDPNTLEEALASDEIDSVARAVATLSGVNRCRHCPPRRSPVDGYSCPPNAIHDICLDCYGLVPRRTGAHLMPAHGPLEEIVGCCNFCGTGDCDVYFSETRSRGCPRRTEYTEPSVKRLDAHALTSLPVNTFPGNQYEHVVFANILNGGLAGCWKQALTDIGTSRSTLTMEGGEFVVKPNRDADTHDIAATDAAFGSISSSSNPSPISHNEPASSAPAASGTNPSPSPSSIPAPLSTSTSEPPVGESSGSTPPPPPPASSTPLATLPLPSVCRPCFAKISAALLYAQRRDMPRSALPPLVAAREDCWYGRSCRTQRHNVHHAMTRNHVCEATRGVGM